MVEVKSRSELPKVGDAVGGLRRHAGLREHRKQDGCQDRDDGDNDEQLNQCEGASQVAHGSLCIPSDTATDE